MHIKAALAVLAAASQLVSAAPAARGDEASAPAGQRLIKTSEEDPGQWVTEEGKAALVKSSQRTGFIDITDVQVRE